MKHSENLFQKIAKHFAAPETWVWLFAVLLLVPNIALCITERVSLLSKLTNILLPLGVYLILISLSKKIGRTIMLFLPICVLCAFQIVLLYLYGEGIIAIDMFMNVVTTNPSEAGELLGNMQLALVTVFVCYLPPIVYAIIAICKKRYVKASTLISARKWGVGYAVLGLASLFAAKTFADQYQPRHEIFPYNVIENLVNTINRAAESAEYYETSQNFTYCASETHAADIPEVYVFVIGETSRADNWQLFGYERETNPLLSQRSNITVFKRTLSEINTTHKSVPMLLSHLNSDNFGDSVSCTRSIISAFNDCDYETAFISNQRRNHSYIDYYGEEAQTAVFLTDSGEERPDLDLVTSLKEFITKATAKKLFIVLHSYGSHFEYRNRYNSDMAYFTPETNSDASIENREQLLNAYDNSIRYTDAMLDGVISTLASMHTLSAVVYAADHGEDIFDDSRKRFLHSSPVPTYWQLHVPMFVWLSPEYIKAYPSAETSLRRNADKDVSSTTSTFHTILDIAGLRSPYFNQSLSLISNNYKPQPRRYINDYNESVDLYHCGLRDQDFEMLRKQGIHL